MKNLSWSALFFASLLSLISFASQAADENRYGHQKVVYHINYDDAKKQSSTLRNIQNHINAVGEDNLDIQVVLHGNGLSLLLKPEALKNVPKFKAANADTQMKQKIDQLKMQGVRFNVCANTVKGREVNVERDLYDVEKSSIVPSGVAELAYLQSKGYLYLRP
ncbi:DsrE family protein [Thiomicrorhabdus heinhorstiae]|uniref:DsrE family protein n=1 Tax=Thiomicrorhabdus heinhorstiae TaxID=2748010 RepID=A0ABS0BT85_9GAMM|nr:DsrE family protein [Thiomicrorhabdus heinhorstiae]MBF6057058.1 DsrE family protein [Thiomicrorhabdus heinhorstiae]